MVENVKGWEWKGLGSGTCRHHGHEWGEFDITYANKCYGGSSKIYFYLITNYLKITKKILEIKKS